MNNKTWTYELPGPHRIAQPHENVQAGDYMQIGSGYSLVPETDWMIPYYRPSGGPFGTFWRAIHE